MTESFQEKQSMTESFPHKATETSQSKQESLRRSGKESG